MINQKRKYVIGITMVGNDVEIEKRNSTLIDLHKNLILPL